MAEIRSLGVHTPVALPYLVTEGIFPEDPRRDSYQWETYVFDEGNGDVEEEVFVTKTCVVWSQGKFVRNVYRFELEVEDVAQALLTNFSTGENAVPKKSQHTKRLGYGKGDGDHCSEKAGRPTDEPSPDLGASARALVVFLKSKAHIYFLHGTSHIVDLPFEIERAFPAPRGIILQRKALPVPSLPPTPQAPAAPPNSFFSSQLHPSSSYLQSPTLLKSFGSTQPPKPSPLSGNGRLDGLFQDVIGSLGHSTDEDTASLHTLTNPLSDLGVVTFSLQHLKPRLSTKTPPGLSVEFETLSSSEQMIYISPCDELAHDSCHSHGELFLMVTASHDLSTLTIWHAWYIEERSLASLLKQRAAHKAAKARRRSSFLSASMGTGTATPAVRHREGTRESFAAIGSMQEPTAASSRKPTRQEEEEAMASQMDPDYQLVASQQTARESRRISSLNADVRASQNMTNPGSVGAGGRRNASFGGPNERRSLGHRKSRGSTPASVFSRSLGLDDDMMDLDSSLDPDGDETVEAVVRHVRATFEAAGADSIFSGADKEFKREVVVRKLHSFPLASQSPPTESAFGRLRVAMLGDQHLLSTREEQRINVYVHDVATKNLQCLRLSVKHRTLWPELAKSSRIAIPVVDADVRLGQCTDIVKIKDGLVQGLLLADRGLILSLDDQTPLPISVSAPYRMYDTFHVFSTNGQVDRDVGKNRILEGLPRGTLELRHPGSSGRYDEVGKDGICHRREIRLWPKDAYIGQLLQVLRSTMPAEQADAVPGVWRLAYASIFTHSERLVGTRASLEVAAFVTTVLSFTLHLIDERARAALNLSRVAAGKQKTTGIGSLRLQREERGLNLSTRYPWSWMSELSPTSAYSPTAQGQEAEKDQLLIVAASLADELLQSGGPWMSKRSLSLSPSSVVRLMLGLHIFGEEQKLCTLSSGGLGRPAIAALIAQLGSWLGIRSWSYASGQYYELEDASEEQWVFMKSTPRFLEQMPLMEEPVGVLQWFECALMTRSGERYPCLADVVALDSSLLLSDASRETLANMTPRIRALSKTLVSTAGLNTPAVATVELMARHHITGETLETLPESIAASFKEAISKCERHPPTTWSRNLLDLVGREDLDIDTSDRPLPISRAQTNLSSGPRDIHTVCHSLDHRHYSFKTKEAGRHEASQLIFNEDRRLVEATSLMHFNNVQVAECPKQPDWSDTYHFEQQRRAMQWVTTRMIALPAGDGMIHFDSQTPLLTDKYHLPGFSNSCLMHPMGHTLTTDRSGLTEEKVNWAYFHAGVSVGLRISRNVKGIDTSWIAFNKPDELTNRHAGLLLALGLSGHLRHLAKWLSFKYLTPKHMMTSVGLLLGLSASYMGTMDGLITRMLSVHITRMLPPGAAELNVSPTTQTAGLMGIGLLYYNTQHRRMSEIMLSEIEHMELEDPDSGPDPLRDESYRLAAGFALGFINLSKGKDLRGLHGLDLPERLLAVAVGPRPVSAVHVFDRATAGAIIAIALVYMKSGDKAIARKIDIPDTEAQFDHVRPDMLLLRAMAKHLILWDSIEAKESTEGIPTFTQANLPVCYQNRFRDMKTSSGRHPLTSSDVPFFNVTTGLVWALSLKYAGTSNTHARDEILTILDCLYTVKGGADAYYYDAKLARSTVRRCIDVLALSAATVMAGTGDLKTFRYLRRLHGRTDEETPYGSHLATHLAIGVLFLGGGTYTLGTSNLAIASLVCAFYPLLPTDVHDNHVHLQAFRHFWVFAAEARCLVVENIDTRRPIPMPITVTMTDGSTGSLRAPCLLPELELIATVQTDDPAYWRVTLDFAANPQHLAAFKQDQRVLVRRCPASEAHHSAFSITLAALNGAQSAQASNHIWQSIFSLPVFRELDKADTELILPPSELQSSTHTDERGTVVDDCLVLSKAVDARNKSALWNLRVLFAWAEKARDEGEGRLRWIGMEVVEALKAKVEERLRGVPAVES